MPSEASSGTPTRCITAHSASVAPMPAPRLARSPAERSNTWTSQPILLSRCAAKSPPTEPPITRARGREDTTDLPGVVDAKAGRPAPPDRSSLLFASCTGMLSLQVVIAGAGDHLAVLWNALRSPDLVPERWSHDLGLKDGAATDYIDNVPVFLVPSNR